MDEIYGTAFQEALEAAHKVAEFTDGERAEAYEPLKSKIYELLTAGQTDTHAVAEEAVCWLRQRTQLIQSTNRVIGVDPPHQQL